MADRDPPPGPGVLFIGLAPVQVERHPEPQRVERPVPAAVTKILHRGERHDRDGLVDQRARHESGRRSARLEPSGLPARRFDRLREIECPPLNRVLGFHRAIEISEPTIEPGSHSTGCASTLRLSRGPRPRVVTPFDVLQELIQRQGATAANRREPVATRTELGHRRHERLRVIGL